MWFSSHQGVIESLAGRIFYFPLPLFCRRLPTSASAKSVITGKKKPARSSDVSAAQAPRSFAALRNTRLFVISRPSSSTHLVVAWQTNLSASNSDHTDSLISRVVIKRQLLPHCALKSLRSTVPAFEMDPKERKKEG